MGKLSRDKGANFEREIANAFKREGIDARRGGASQSFAANLDPDVILADLPGLWIECKKGTKTYPLKALKQAKAACSNNTPVAICRDDREKAIVTMEFDFFILLLTATFPDIVKAPELMTPCDESDTLQETLDDGQLQLQLDPID